MLMIDEEPLWHRFAVRMLTHYGPIIYVQSNVQPQQD
jgi:hypothetical protein